MLACTEFSIQAITFALFKFQRSNLFHLLADQQNYLTTQKGPFLEQKFQSGITIEKNWNHPILWRANRARMIVNSLRRQNTREKEKKKRDKYLCIENKETRGMQEGNKVPV